MDLNSTAFAQGGDIPRKYTCEGDDIAPPLSWSDVPERTLSLALIVDDRTRRTRRHRPAPGCTSFWSTLRPARPRFPRVAGRCPKDAATA